MPVKGPILSDQGFGLLEVLIAAGLFAIIAAALTNNAVVAINSQRTVELDGDRWAFKQRIYKHYSCYQTQTLPSTKCKNLGPIDLEDTSGGPLLPKRGKTIGKWTYVAECTSTAGAINVRAVRFIENMFTNLNLKDLDHLDPNADINVKQNYIKDPLTKKSYTIKEDESFLFPANKPLCEGNYHPDQIIPFFGSYPIGQPNALTPFDVGGKPKFVGIFNPSGPSTTLADYCVATDQMNALHICGSDAIPGSNFSITLTDTGFTVSGDLVKATPPPPPAYQSWVYFGFKDVAH